MLMWCLNTFYSNTINYIKTQLSHCFKILKYYSAKTQKDIFSVPQSLLRGCRQPPLPFSAAAEPGACGRSLHSCLAAGLQELCRPPSAARTDKRTQGRGQTAGVSGSQAPPGNDHVNSAGLVPTLGLRFCVHRTRLSVNLKGSDPRNLTPISVIHRLQ